MIYLNKRNLKLNEKSFLFYLLKIFVEMSWVEIYNSIMSSLCSHDNEKLLNAVKEKRLDLVIEYMKTCSLSNANWVILYEKC